MNTSNVSKSPIGKVLTYNPKTNTTQFLDYTEKTVHKKHGKMYKIKTSRGYEVKVTDDHSLCTNGDDNFFKPLKPEEALGKFVPIIHSIEYSVSITDEIKAKEVIDKSIEKSEPSIVHQEFLSLNKESLSYYLSCMLAYANSYTCLTNEDLGVFLISLARIGIAVKKINGLTVMLDKDNTKYIPDKGVLKSTKDLLSENPANPYINLPYTWDTVTSVEEIEREEITYDFSVPEFPLFIANGILLYDTMMVHVPSTQEARTEALNNMLPSKNLFQPRTLQPLNMPQQEHVMGLYVASKDIPDYYKSKVSAPEVMDMDKLLNDIKMGAIKPNAPVKYQGHLTSAGMAIINSYLPLHLRKYDQVWDQKYMARVLSMIGKQDPNKYAFIAGLLKDLGALYGYKLRVTFKQSDFDLSKLKKLRDAYFNKTEKNIAKIEASGLSNKDKDIAIGKELRKAQAFSMDLTAKETSNTFNRWWATGAKGKQGVIAQIIASPTVVADPKDRLIPQLIRHSYLEGLRPSEYFTSSYGTRKGSVGAKLSVAPAGSLNKEIVGNVLDVVISCKDCNTSSGIKRSIDDEENILYRIEARTNKFIDPTYLETLKKKNVKEVIVRSPATCNAREGVCQYCYGFDERGKFPDIGANVGVNSAEAVTEPLTQLGLSSKHTAGSAAADTVGFNTIKSFYNMSSKFSGSAVISEVTGKVSKIEKALTGGTNVWIDRKKYYIPPGREVRVKLGDNIKAGDPISDGILNFSKVVPYKGIEEGRNQFIESASNLYDKAGQHSIKKNFEVIARGLINYVEIKDPKDFDEYVEGDIVDYNKLQADIRMHPGKKPPVFEPIQKGTNKAPTFKSDWLTNFGFRYLKQKLIDNAATFSKSKKHQYNPIGPYVRGITFGKGENGKY